MTRGRVLQTNMAEMRVPPHVADMILNHAIKGAPRSRQHYDVHHYIPEKREALTQWVKRLTKILGYDPNEVMTAERNGFQGKGPDRRESLDDMRRPCVAEPEDDHARFPARRERCDLAEVEIEGENDALSAIALANTSTSAARWRPSSRRCVASCPSWRSHSTTPGLSPMSARNFTAL
jgi:hypothetical protein